MKRKIIAVVAGVITGFVFVFVGDATTKKVYDVGSLNQSEGAKIPGYILVLLVTFWVLSAFFGGMVAARINRIQWKQSSVITGTILMGVTLLNLAMNPHPAAMWFSAIILYLPVSLLGGYLVRGKSAPPPIATN